MAWQMTLHRVDISQSAQYHSSQYCRSEKYSYPKIIHSQSNRESFSQQSSSLPLMKCLEIGKAFPLQGAGPLLFPLRIYILAIYLSFLNSIIILSVQTHPMRVRPPITTYEQVSMVCLYVGMSCIQWTTLCLPNLYCKQSMTISYKTPLIYYPSCTSSELFVASRPPNPDLLSLPI